MSKSSVVVIRKPARKKPSLSTLVIISVILLGMIFLFHNFLYRDAEAMAEAETRLIEDLVPEQATDVRFITQSAFQSGRWKLRFTIPASSLSDFIEDFCPDTTLVDGGYIPLVNNESVEWWRPEDAQIYSSGRCIENSIVLHHILIDKTDPDEFLIYMEG